MDPRLSFDFAQDKHGDIKESSLEKHNRHKFSII